jgi:23S rRNA (pseudouridine1915-N3)-methyltransferase
MIRFRIVSVGKPPKDWREAAFDHYARLLRPMAHVDSVFVKESRTESDRMVDQAIEQEGERLIKEITSSYTFALDKSGKEYSSEELAKRIEALSMGDSTLEFMIGGPFGLHPRVLEASNEVLSLSRMTFPHDFARVLLTEQLYRAMSILRNLPYHK